MKKIIFILLLSFFLFGCGSKDKDPLQKCLDSITFETIVDKDLEFKDQYIVDGKTINAYWHPSDSLTIDNKGHVTRHQEDKTVYVNLTLSLDNKTLEKQFEFVVKAAENHLTDFEILENFSESIQFEDVINSNLNLLTEYAYEGKTITAIWESEDENILSNEGIITRTYENQLVCLQAIFILNDSETFYQYDLIIEALDKESAANEILDLLVVPENVIKELSLTKSISHEGKNYRVTWKSNKDDIISYNGEITHQNEDTEVILTAKINFEGEVFEKEFNVTLKALDKNLINDLLDTISFDQNISDDIFLPTKVTDGNWSFNIIWSSSSPEFLDENGKVGVALQDQNVILTATIIEGAVSITKNFEICVLKTNNEDLFNILLDIYSVPKKITNNIALPTKLDYNLTGTWVSSNPSILSNEGIINNNGTPTQVSITFSTNIGGTTMSKTFDTIVCAEKHLFQTNIFEGTLENVIYTDNKTLELAPNALSGTFTSNETDYVDFTEVVASWCAITSKDATCEVLVSLKVDGVYSDYVTYGKWGLGLKNASYDQTKSTIKLSTDEIKVLNSKQATGFKYQIKLQRSNLDIKSPSVSYITLAFLLSNYTFDIDQSLLSDYVLYDVPKLYQHDVPVIGNSICSITSSTMLLKYKGHDFSAYNKLEHEYLATLFKDYGNNIFGNWTHNCVGMSSYGEKAYVKRFASTNEFLYSLQTVGPMAASIKGTVIYHNLATDQAGSYTSAGHLLVVTGFEIANGQTNVFINDPNVRGVTIKMTLQNFLNIWRNVSYIIE